MIGWYLYMFQVTSVIVGVFLWSVVYWPSKNVTRNVRFINKATELRQRRKALSLAGVGLTMIGLMLLVDTYRSRHTEAEGVIYLPPSIVNAMLVMGTVLLVIGVSYALVKTRQMSRIAGPVTTIEPEFENV